MKKTILTLCSIGLLARKIIILFTLAMLTTGSASVCAQTFAGAQWIGGGADDMTLYAPYLTTFRLSWTTQGDGWLRFGGGDERFTNAYRNPWHIENCADSVYVSVSADSKLGELTICRMGMDKSGREQITLAAEGLKAPGQHRVVMAVAYGTTDVAVDGKKIGTVNLNPARGKMNESLNLTGDFAAYPCVGKVCSGGGTSDIELRHYRSPQNIIAKGTIADRSPIQLRTSFSTRKQIAKATLFITARGIYDAYINGAQVNAESFFCPGFTQYDRTQLYQTYDVTGLIKQGDNRMEVALSEGWWSGASTYSAHNWNFYGDRQSLLARLMLTYADGTVQNVVTTPDGWECCSDGARLYASMFQGEVMDGRRKLFDDKSNWHKASLVPTTGTTVEGEDYGRVELVEQEDASVHPIDTLMAQSCSEVRPKVFVYDMGQNMAGVPMITLRNQQHGTTVRLRFAEVLYPELEKFGDLQGEMLTENYRAAMSQDIYICGGGAEEKFLPRHTLHGFRYIEITGIDRPLPLTDVNAIALSSLNGITAHYECSDTLVNRLWENILWSARSNFVSIPTDCPQRNERMGWSGDISVFSHTATYLSDVEAFLKRHLRTMRDTQSHEGQFTDVAPMRGEGFGGLLWGSAGITVAWQCYERWKNTEILREHYDAMAKYMEFVRQHYIDKATGVIVQHRQWGDLGDWLSPEYDANDHSLLWEAYYIYDLDIMSKTATVLGRNDEAAEYAKRRDERKAFFRSIYLSPDHRTVWSSFNKQNEGKDIGTQVSYILPIVFDICESAEQRDALVRHLVKLIEDNNYHLMVGFIGVPWISEALTKIGRDDLVYRILACTEYPSWLYSVCQGATTIWERLNAYVAGEGFPAGNSMNSFNHYSFGSIGSWLIERSLGICVSGTDIVIRPMPDTTGHLTFARGHYDSRMGRIESGWQREENGTTTLYTFSIPKGTKATVIIPGKKPRIYRSGTHKVRVR